MGDSHHLYIINSSLGINSLFNFLMSHSTSKKDLVSLRKDYTRNSVTRNYSETSRRFAILNEKLYDILISLGYGLDNKKDEDIEIIQFQSVPEDYAHKKSSVMHFYFPLDSINDNVEIIRKKLNYITAMGIMNKEDWYLHKQGICEFSNKVDDSVKIMIKTILDNPLIFRVSWCRINIFNKIERFFDN